MGLSKETFVDLQEKFEKVKKLIEEDCKLDPPDEPYKSKYAAKNLLTTMKTTIEKLQENSIAETKILLESMLGIVWLHLGIISVDTEELSTGKTQLNTCLNLVEKDPLKPEFILIVINCLNHLGLLWSNWNDTEKSKEYLMKSQKFFNQFKESERVPYSFIDIFNATGARDVDEAKLSLERTHTFTMYYLAQVYTALKETLKASVYCHITIRKQLEYNDFDPIDWALSTATLSQFLIEQNGFKQARHHLAAATYVLNQYEDKLNTSTETGEEREAKLEIFQHRYADIARCWLKYDLLLLTKSKERLMKDDDDDDNEGEYCSLENALSKLDLTPDNTLSKEDIMNFYFPTLKLDQLEQQVTDKFILTYEDARSVFLNAQTWVQRAQSYYTLETHASDHVQIIQDLSQLYKYLAFFEDDPERQCKMHKRRIDHLEKVLKELNPTYYMSVCRQLWYELGETYDSILDIKMDKLNNSDGKPTPHAVQKVNNLIEKSIENFTKLLDSLKLPSTNQMPDDIPENYEKSAMKAYFYLGVLYGKFLAQDKNTALDHAKKRLECLNKMIDYCKKHKNVEEHCHEELSVCKEMVSILPLKISNLQNSITNA